MYAVLKKLMFFVDQSKLPEGVLDVAVVIEKQISYLSDEEGYAGLMEYLGNNPYREVFDAACMAFDENNPATPLALWRDIDPVFRKLIGALTNFDPRKRVTAKQALEHEWFQDV